jgi:uncharacterized protein (TIGR03437 family)
MFKRLSALCAFSLVLGAAALQAQEDLFVLPGAASGSGDVEAFLTNPLSNYRTIVTSLGSFAIIGSPNGSTFYLIASSTTGTIIATDSTLLTPTVVASLPNPASQGIITPDGKVLAVTAGTLHLFATATNTELVPGGISQGGGMSTFAVAASLDSSTLFVLGSNITAGTSQLTAINTATHASTATMALSQVATAISVGPNGLLYVSLPNEILEVDPRTLETTYGGTMMVGGTPGPLTFTPDGQYAVAANQSSGSSLFIVTLVSHSVIAPSLGLPQLTSVQATGVDSVMAVSIEGVYKIAISNSPSVTQVAVTGFALGGAAALATTNDVPAGTHSTVEAAYVSSGTTLSQINPASNQVVAQYQIASNVTPGVLSYIAPPLTGIQTNAASLVTYGTNQTILPSATSEPLVVQVLDSENLPVSGVSVQFQSSSSGVALASSSAVTGTNGDALTYVTASAATGPILVTATAGSLTATFTVQVSATAQGSGTPALSIVAGQGQILLSNSSTLGGAGYGSPLEVLVTDANGNPAASVPVTFTIPPAEGTLVVNNAGALSEVVTTNASGLASVDFQTTGLPSDNTQAFLQSTITASAPNTNQVIFYLTTVNGSPSPYVYVLAPAAGSSLAGTAGGTLPSGVSVKVLSASGVGIPNVSVVLNDGNLNPTLYPTVACSGGTVLTSASGQANCNVVFGPRIGTGTFTATIGYTHSSEPFPFTVTAGPAAVVQITQGNNQVGIAGQKLPLALLIHVTDAGGNAVPNAPVNWQVLTAGAVTLSNVANTTNSVGNASAIATLGNIGGVAQVQVTVGGASATFNLTVNIPTSGIQKLSGDKQTTTVDTAFPLPLTVEVVNAGGTGISGLPVNFLVTKGTATLGTASTMTDANGQASTTVTAGATAGTITVSATSGSFSATFTLTAQPAGPYNITVVNGASFLKGTGISPGGIATISGNGFLPGVTGLVAPSAGALPTTLAGLTVTFGTAATPAPIYYVLSSNGTDQVTVQVPFEVPPGSAVELTLTLADGEFTTVKVPVKPFAPGIFTTVFNGKIYPVALRPDGTQVSPTNPAQLGENITVFLTGLGQVSPATATGQAGVAGQSIVAPLIIGLNNGGVPLISAEYAPGSVGVYSITLQVPADTKTGPYQPLGVVVFDSSNKAYYANSTYLPIQ